MAEEGKPVAPMAKTTKWTSDHLANERTFLAWVRTSLALIGLGFVLARMGLFLGQIVALRAPGNDRLTSGGHEFILAGIVFLILGVGCAAWSGWGYDRVRRSIDAGSYEPASRAVLLMTSIVVAGGFAIVVLVVWRTSGLWR
ncbi:YidH family protein [Singulisphaera sp. PoT]|uniref:YidH family protein n=1 Tax=Singulisphaera sp. PoT TaxID=3411797 RepID=UPI003BF4F7E5